MNDSHSTHIDLQVMARQLMLEHGFEPDFPATVQKQLADIKARPPLPVPSSREVRDLRNLLWSSIDNDTSRDLDQIEVAERIAGGDTKVMVAIADVDSFVAQASPIDDHAAREATTVLPGCAPFQCCRRSSRPGRRRCLKTRTDWRLLPSL